MTKFEELIQLLQAHQNDQDWCASEEGKKVLAEALAVAPPEVLAEYNRVKRYNAITEEIDSKNAEDPLWMFSDEAYFMLVDWLSVTPREIRDKVHSDLKEAGLWPQNQCVDDHGEPLYTLEDIAKVSGLPLEEAEERYKELIANNPDWSVATGKVHRLH